MKEGIMQALAEKDMEKVGRHLTLDVLLDRQSDKCTVDTYMTQTVEDMLIELMNIHKEGRKAKVKTPLAERTQAISPDMWQPPCP